MFSNGEDEIVKVRMQKSWRASLNAWQARANALLSSVNHGIPAKTRFPVCSMQHYDHKLT